MLKSLPLLPRCSFTRIILSKMNTMATPKVPKFISVGDDIHSSRSKSDGIRFSLISYNILAQVYVKSSLFPHSPSSCLKWKARSQAILAVLKAMSADFFCLQFVVHVFWLRDRSSETVEDKFPFERIEYIDLGVVLFGTLKPLYRIRFPMHPVKEKFVGSIGTETNLELDEYDEFYKGMMESYGYSSIYMKRSGQKRDGCGIFFKNDSAELILQEKIEYNDLVNTIPHEDSSCDHKSDDTIARAMQDGAPKSNAVDRGDSNDPRVRLKRDCVAIFGAFKLKKPFDHIVIVANTHLYWDPEWTDVKLAQAKYLLSCLGRFKTIVSEKFEALPSVIVAGDFNSTPGDKVYKYLVSGNSSSGESMEGEEDTLPLCSVYEVTRGEPPFTNCTPGFTGTIDYLLFSPSDTVTPLSFLELPDSDSPTVIGGLPNYHHPSDHLPIGAEFEISRV